MKECDRINGLFGEFHDRHVDAGTEKLMRDHFLSCTSCREDFKWYGFTVQALARLEEKFKIESVCYFGYIAYPLLGFPDLVDFFHGLPFGLTVANWLIRLDEWISRIPLINRLSWGIIISGKKR